MHWSLRVLLNAFDVQCRPLAIVNVPRVLTSLQEGPGFARTRDAVEGTLSIFRRGLVILRAGEPFASGHRDTPNQRHLACVRYRDDCGSKLHFRQPVGPAAAGNRQTGRRMLSVTVLAWQFGGQTIEQGLQSLLEDGAWRWMTGISNV